MSTAALGMPKCCPRPLRDAQGAAKGAQGFTQECPMGTHDAPKVPPDPPRGPSGADRIAPETSQTSRDTFHDQIFDSKSKTNGLAIETSYLSEAMAYLHVNSNRCPPER